MKTGNENAENKNNMKAINGIKFGKKGIKADGKYFPCWYSLATLINGKTAITIYAKCILTGLPKSLQPENNSDMQTDYFEKDRVRFYEGSEQFNTLKEFCA